MRKKEIRRQIAAEAAKLLTSGREGDFTTAKRRAARILGVRFTATDFPNTREIKDAVRRIEEMQDEGSIDVNPRRMQIAALRLMRRLRDFHPRLIGHLSQGKASTGLETTIDLVSDSLARVINTLRAESIDPLISEQEPIDAFTVRRGVLHLSTEYPVKIRVYSKIDSASVGLTIESLEESLDGGTGNLDAEVEGIEAEEDRFEVIADLLAVLENVALDTTDHPEGDSLYHSLQLFDLAVSEQPYDEEFLSAALLHDVGRIGKGVDTIKEASKLLDRLVTHRTMNIIAGLALALSEPTPGRSALQAIIGSEDLDDVMLLAQLDRQARKRGVRTSSIDEAIDYLRGLESGSLWSNDA